MHIKVSWKPLCSFATCDVAFSRYVGTIMLSLTFSWISKRNQFFLVHSKVQRTAAYGQQTFPCPSLKAPQSDPGHEDIGDQQRTSSRPVIVISHWIILNGYYLFPSLTGDWLHLRESSARFKAVKVVGLENLTLYHPKHPNSQDKCYFLDLYQAGIQGFRVRQPVTAIREK